MRMLAFALRNNVCKIPFHIYPLNPIYRQPFLFSKHTTHGNILCKYTCAARYGTACRQFLAIANYIYLASSGELIPTYIVCAYGRRAHDADSLKLFIKCRLDGGDGQNCTEAQYAILSLALSMFCASTRHLKRTQKRFIIAC